MEPELRVISGEDWAAFRALRLRALADSPDVFGVTLAEAEANPEAVWRARAAGPGPIVVVFEGERPLAMGGLHTPEATGDAFVWGMWVEPESRGRGLGSLILEELSTTARRERRAVSLHVTVGNGGARRLYEAHGFADTGEVEPLRPGSSLRIARLRRE